MENSEKMNQLASYLFQLNKKGKVKEFKGNKNKEAKVYQILKGCSVWIHLEEHDQLIFDLMISDTAKEDHPVQCQNSVTRFTTLLGPNVKSSRWKHSINANQDHDRYYLDINSKDLDEIKKMIQRVRQSYLVQPV